MINVGFTGITTFRVVQHNKPVINAMNKFKKRRKATCTTTFYSSTVYTKLPHNKHLIIGISVINFCFDGGASKYITVLGKKHYR